MTYAYHVFLLLGGIGLFLYGINFLSASLYEALGDNLRNVLEKLTTNPVKSVMLGLVVTALIQSSGATMVMVTGFVAAQLMTLVQGMYVMMGAAIGTTVTAQIIAFEIEPWAPLILFAGAVLYLFIKKRLVKKIGSIILAFGLLFTGIYVMGEAIDRMSLGVVVKAFLDSFDNPLLMLLFGFVFTFIIQSSSASVGILQVIMASTAAGDFELGSVVFMIIGMNVGAIAPVLISSFAGNRAGKRAAIAALVTKILSALLFIIIVLIWPGCIDIIASTSAKDVSRQIANFHLIFNVVTTVLLFPLLGMISKQLIRLMPDDPEDTMYSRKLLYIGRGQDKASSVMISQCRQEIFRFSDLVKANYEKAMTAFFAEDVDSAAEVKEHEETINYLNRAIFEYLVILQGKRLPAGDLKYITRMFTVLANLERIGDHADNIAEYTIIAKENHATVSKAAWLEVQDMGWKSNQIVIDAIDAYKTESSELLGKVELEEDVIDNLKLTLENNHIERMKQRACDPRGGTLFIDVLTDFERVADHSLNIAQAMLIDRG